MKRSLLVLVLLFVSILMLITAPVVAAKQEKVKICHITGKHDFGEGVVPIGHVISVARPALPSHIDHGDLELEKSALKVMLDGSEVCTIPDSCEQASGGKMIFLTFNTIPISMSGLGDEELEKLIGEISDPKAKADAICNYYAQEASLCGTYEAWMAIGDPPAHVPSFPLVRTDNEPVAENQDQLNSLGSKEDPICVDEWGIKHIDAQNSPRIAWRKTIEAENTNPDSITTCCKQDDEDSSISLFGSPTMKCSQVGYAIGAMGFNAFLDPSNPAWFKNMISFTECALPASVEGDLKVRIYCIQQ